MRQHEIADRLVLIEKRLSAIETALIGRSAPASNIAQALADIEASYGLIGQMAEVAHAQREQIEALIGRLDRLLSLLEQHDSRLVTYATTSDRERADLHELLIQLRELARKQVGTIADLARAVGDGSGAWGGEERRGGGAERRRTG